MPDVGWATSHLWLLSGVKEKECCTFKCKKVFFHKAVEPPRSGRVRGVWGESSWMTSGLDFEKSSELEGGR